MIDRAHVSAARDFSPRAALINTKNDHFVEADLHDDPEEHHANNHHHLDS